MIRIIKKTKFKARRTKIKFSNSLYLIKVQNQRIIKTKRFKTNNKRAPNWNRMNPHHLSYLSLKIMSWNYSESINSNNSNNNNNKRIRSIRRCRILYLINYFNLISSNHRCLSKRTFNSNRRKTHNNNKLKLN